MIKKHEIYFRYTLPLITWLSMYYCWFAILKTFTEITFIGNKKK